MSLSTNQIAVSAALGEGAPLATVDINLSSTYSGTLDVADDTTNNGISSVVMAATTDTTATVQILFKLPSELGIGTYRDTLLLAVCTDASCTSQIAGSPQTVSVTYTVTPAGGALASLASLSPATTVAGGPGFTLTANGSGFTAASTVLWNGSARTTTYLSSDQLTAQITAADISVSGAVTVTVSGAQGSGLGFTIQAPAPLALDALYPASVTSGGPGFALSVAGTGFASSSAVTLNGLPRPTIMVSTTELRASLSAADIASVGNASIAVENPAGSSNALTLTIAAPSRDAVAFQITPWHSGAMTFNSVSFPTSSTWSVDLGGAPSYALIAAGKVFVTVSGSGLSELVALDQATGAKVWGPISLGGGYANAAYDAGTVFVLSTMGFLQAFDGGSGTLKWSTRLTGQWVFSSAPTAANGLVYAGAAGSGGTLYAVNAANGAMAWTKSVANGDTSIPAVTADAVYVTYPCQTYDFQAETGESLWANNSGCDGGGGATPVVANGELFAPNGFGTYNGATFDAQSGAQTGVYAADNPPAIGAQTGFFLQSRTLRGLTLATNTVEWSFAGDGLLVTSPIIVNQYVFVGSSGGTLYALDGATGAQAWTYQLGAALPNGAGWGSGMAVSGLAAGDGLLVVPAGTKLTAFTLSSSP
jgi:outer membrane protein assembly factor BamB